MKKLIFILSIFFIFSCSPEEEKLVPDNYKDWELFTQTKLNYFIPGHEDNYRISYINKRGLEFSIKTDEHGRKFYNYPTGTIILKEIYPTMNYQPTDSPEYYTVMVKNPDHPAAQGGWVWLVKNHQTKKETIFHSDMCVNCHEGANSRHPYGDKNPDGDFRDYAFFTYDGKTNSLNN